MNIQQRMLIASAALGMFLYSTLAFAVYGQQVVIQSGDASALQGATLSFTTAAGEAVPVTIEEEADGRITATIQFSGDRRGGQSERGTLVVLDNGESTSFALPPARVDEYLLVGLETGNVSMLTLSPGMAAAPATPGWTLGIGGFASDLTTPEIGTSGVISEGGSESFILRGVDSVDLTGVNVSLSRNLGGQRNAKMFGAFQSGTGDDQTTADVPTMTTNTALVFTDFIQGVTGIGVFPVGVQSSLDVDVDVTQFRFGYQFDFRQTPESRLTARFYGQYGEMEIEQNSTDTLIDPAFGGQNPSATRNQELEQTEIDVYAGLRYTRDINDVAAWFIEGGPIVRVLDADWTSTERVQCAICGAPLIDNTVERSASESGTSVGGQASLGLDFNLGENTVLEFEAYYRGGMDNAAPINPQSGDDLAVLNQPTFLSTDTSAEFGGRVRILFSF